MKGADGRDRSGTWKPDREEYTAAARRHGIRYLIHYTPATNLESIIRSGGILSRRERARRGAEPVREHGWGEKREALADYVCLCFGPPLGLLRREKAPMAALVVRPGVIALRETLFSPMNSAREWIGVEELQSRCDLASFEDLFSGPVGPELRSREAEVLVRRVVPLAAVGRIVLPEGVQAPGDRRLRAICWFERVVRRRKHPRWSVDRDGTFFL